jgi:hypothetical protein
MRAANWTSVLGHQLDASSTGLDGHRVSIDPCPSSGSAVLALSYLPDNRATGEVALHIPPGPLPLPNKRRSSTRRGDRSANAPPRRPSRRGRHEPEGASASAAERGWGNWTVVQGAALTAYISHVSEKAFEAVMSRCRKGAVLATLPGASNLAIGRGPATRYPSVDGVDHIGLAAGPAS